MPTVTNLEPVAHKRLLLGIPGCAGLPAAAAEAVEVMAGDPGKLAVVGTGEPPGRPAALAPAETPAQVAVLGRRRVLAVLWVAEVSGTAHEAAENCVQLFQVLAAVEVAGLLEALPV